MDREVAYYGRRAAQEGRAGMTAASEKARQCHFELAAAYEKRLMELVGKNGRPTLHITTAA